MSQKPQWVNSQFAFSAKEYRFSFLAWQVGKTKRKTDSDTHSHMKLILYTKLSITKKSMEYYRHMQFNLTLVYMKTPKIGQKLGVKNIWIYDILCT